MISSLFHILHQKPEINAIFILIIILVHSYAIISCWLLLCRLVWWHDFVGGVVDLFLEKLLVRERSVLLYLWLLLLGKRIVILENILGCEFDGGSGTTEHFEYQYLYVNMNMKVMNNGIEVDGNEYQNIQISILV